MSTRKTLVVIGNGMVGHRFVQAAIERGVTERFDIVVVGEEQRAAYDRVALTSLFEVGAEQPSFLPDGEYDDPRGRLVLETAVPSIDRDARTDRIGTGEGTGLDIAVMATGAEVGRAPGRERGWQ